MATNNNLNNSLPSGFSSIGTTTLNGSGSADTTIGSSAAGAFSIASGSTSTWTTANASLGFNTGTGQLDVCTDATNNTCNLFTGAAQKVATVGSSNSSSQLKIQSGTGNTVISSASGTITTVNSTGEIRSGLTSAFLAYRSGNLNDKTGNGGVYQPIPNGALYNQGSDYATGTGIYTAPVTGRVHFCIGLAFHQAGAITDATSELVASNRTARLNIYGSATYLTLTGQTSSCFMDMDAADTALINVTMNGLAGNTVDSSGNATNLVTWYSAKLFC